MLEIMSSVLAASRHSRALDTYAMLRPLRRLDASIEMKMNI